MSWLVSLYLEDVFNNMGPLLNGLLMTLSLALSVFIVALIIGLLLAIIRFRRLPVLCKLSDGYVYMVRSVPLIMLIALVHYGILPALGVEYSLWVSAFTALTLAMVAYLSELLRGGFDSLHKEELDAAAGLGLSWPQRFMLVFIPLVLSRLTPALVNQSITLIKDTSLVSLIGLIELTRSAEIIYERTLHELTLLGFVAITYFIVCYGLSHGSQWLQRRFCQSS